MEQIFFIPENDWANLAKKRPAQELGKINKPDQSINSFVRNSYNLRKEILHNLQ